MNVFPRIIVRVDHSIETIPIIYLTRMYIHYCLFLVLSFSMLSCGSCPGLGVSPTSGTFHNRSFPLTIELNFGGSVLVHTENGFQPLSNFSSETFQLWWAQQEDSIPGPIFLYAYDISDIISPTDVALVQLADQPLDNRLLIQFREIPVTLYLIDLKFHRIFVFN